MKGGDWTVTELSVDGTNEAELPSWEVEDCDIYDETCEAHWVNDEGGEAIFAWQFRDDGDTFELSRQAEEGHNHAHNHAEEEAISQCYNFSGIYSVSNLEKTTMTFKSSATVGYMGQEVVISISKK